MRKPKRLDLRADRPLDPDVWRIAAEEAVSAKTQCHDAYRHGLMRCGWYERARPYDVMLSFYYPEWLSVLRDPVTAHDAFTFLFHITKGLR